MAPRGDPAGARRARHAGPAPPAARRPRPPASAAGRSWSRSPCTPTRSAAPRRSGSPRSCGWSRPGLAAPLTGLAADRFPRRDVLLAATLARALLLAAAALAVALDAPFALLLVLATLFTVAATAHKPAQAALLPHLAPDRRRQAAANALWTGDRQRRVRRRRDRRRRARRRASARPRRSRRAALAFARGGAAALARHPRATRERRVARALARRDAVDSPLEGLRVVARDRRLRLLVGVLSASTLVEGMVDVLVVVTALRLVDLGDAGVGWLNAAWGDRRARRRRGRAEAARARPACASRCPAGGLLIGLPLLALAGSRSAVAALVALTVLGVGYALVEIGRASRCCSGSPTTASAPARSRVVESSYWLTTGAGAMLAPAARRARRPARRARARRRRAAARSCSPAAPRSRDWRRPPLARRPAAASAAARPARAGARSPVAAPGARPATPAARRS